MSCSKTYTCASLSAADFISKHVEFARYASYQLKWPVSLILAQWSIESSWGKYDICSPCNNSGNTGSPSGGCPSKQYSDLCQGVANGYIAFAKNNLDHKIHNICIGNSIKCFCFP